METANKKHLLLLLPLPLHSHSVLCMLFCIIHRVVRNIACNDAIHSIYDMHAMFIYSYTRAAIVVILHGIVVTCVSLLSFTRFSLLLFIECTTVTFHRCFLLLFSLHYPSTDVTVVVAVVVTTIVLFATQTQTLSPCILF